MPFFSDKIFDPVAPFRAQYAFFTHCKCKCPFLKEGKLYVCALPAMIDYFNFSFNKNILLQKNDSYNIHKSNASAKEIISFMKKPSPFCRFCVTRRPVIPWQRTQYKLDEWCGSNISFLRHQKHMSKYYLSNFIRFLKRKYY